MQSKKTFRGIFILEIVFIKIPETSLEDLNDSWPHPTILQNKRDPGSAE